MAITYGDAVGPGPSYFRSFIEYYITSYDATGVNIKYVKGVEVTAGDFSTVRTALTSDSWCAGWVLGKRGWANSTGWIYDHVNYGAHFGDTARACYSTHVSVASLNITAPAAPTAPTIGTNTRNSDYQNTITWTAATDANRTGFAIQCSINGSDWADVGTANKDVLTFISNMNAVDCSIKYRVGGVYPGNYKVYSAASNITYNTPIKPTSIVGARTSANIIGFIVENASNTATGLVLEASSNGVDGWSVVSNQTGSPVTSFTYSASGTFYYRAANTRGSLKSDYVYTDGKVVALATAYAPSITKPFDGSVVNVTMSTPTFYWQHNPADGTAQTKAEFGIYVNNVWQTQTITGATNYANYSIMSKGSYRIRVRTAGANGTWSPYAYATYTFATAPTAIARSTQSTVTSMPIEYTIQYIDTCGSFAGANLLMYDSNDTLVFSKEVSSLTGQISVSEYLPTNGEEYYLRARARSTSSLTSNDVYLDPFTIDFDPPSEAALNIVQDAETGYCNVRVMFDDDVDHCDLYRVVDGVQTLLFANIPNGSEYQDKYAPLNTAFVYRAITYTDTGIPCAHDEETTISTPRFFCYWGNEIAWARWNPSGSWSFKSGDTQLVHYDGRKYPVMYKGSAINKTNSVSFTLFERERIDAFKKMIADGARCVYKSYDGEVFQAYVELSGNNKFNDPFRAGEISLSLTRIDGGAL